MSSESASSGMARKQVEFDLVEGKLVVKGVDASIFSVDCAQPKLNLRQLYSVVFSDIVEPTKILSSATPSVMGDEHAKAHFTSIKKIVDDAQTEINSKLPAVLTERAKIEKSIAESMTDAAAEEDAVEVADHGESLFASSEDEYESYDPEDWA